MRECLKMEGGNLEGVPTYVLQKLPVDLVKALAKGSFLFYRSVVIKSTSIAYVLACGLCII